MNIELRLDDHGPREMAQQSIDIFKQRLDWALELGAREISDEARKNLAERNGFGSLLNSVNARRVGPLHFEVSPSEAYGIIVEEGSGPAAGRPKYYPNPDALREWLTLNVSYRGHQWARKGSKKRGNQELDIWFRSRAMAWGIYQKGTKAYPFMKPAFEEKKQRVVDLANMALREAIGQLGGGFRAV